MLRLREIPVTLLTARRDPVALAGQLAALGLAPDFHAVEVVDPREAADAKAAHLRAARPALFVGDSETDFAAAERVGVPFIGVDTGQRSAPFLRAAGVRRVSGSLTAIVEYMDATLAGVPPGPRASIHSVDSPRTPA
jgi:phosphoglycolate phosphatase-like HAD superfamily hydrolase